MASQSASVQPLSSAKAEPRLDGWRYKYSTLGYRSTGSVFWVVAETYFRKMAVVRCFHLGMLSRPGPHSEHPSGCGMSN